MEAYRIEKIVRDNKVDLIHILYAEPNALWCLFKKYFSVPMIITCRGTDVLKTTPNTFERRSLINFIVASFYRRAFQMADWVTGTSQQQLNSIKKFSERDTNESIIRTGVIIEKLLVDTSAFYPLKDSYAYILFPRYLKPKPIYNHEFCTRSIELLPEEIRSKDKMVFAGKYSGEYEYQEKLKQMSKATQNFAFKELSWSKIADLCMKVYQAK